MRSFVRRTLASLLGLLCLQGGACAEQQGSIELWQAYAPRAATHSQAELRWTPQWSGAPADGWRWLLAPELAASTPALQQGAAPWRDGDAPAALRLQQAYIGYRAEQWQLRVGKQVFDWSQTDTISPADLLNARDWSDITRVRKLGVPALSLRYGNQTSVEWVWIPSPSVSMLPAGPWLPGAVASLLSPQQQRPDGGETALRLVGNWQQTDLSLIWYRGHSKAPDLALHAAPQGAALQAYYPDLQAQVLTLARQVGAQNIARLELARYRQSGGVDFLEYVASIDQELSGVANDADTLYFLLQAADSNDRASARNALGWPDFRRVLERNVQFKASYDPHSNRHQLFELTGTWNRGAHDRYWQLSYQRRLGEHLSATLGLAVASGRADTFWGAYRDTNRVYLNWVWRY